MGKRESLQQMDWGNWISTGKRMILDYNLIHTKINLKWIKNLNIRPETLKFLEENKGKMLLHFGISGDFLNMTPNLHETNKKCISKTYQTKSFCTEKDTTE